MIRVQNMALLSDLAEGVSDANRPSLSLDFRHAQCIASDDPRLEDSGHASPPRRRAGPDRPGSDGARRRHTSSTLTAP